MLFADRSSSSGLQARLRYRRRVTETSHSSSSPKRASVSIASTRCARFAIVWMAIFHFSFDLDHFGFTHQNFYADPFWTVQRTCIVSLFSLLSPASGRQIAMEQQSERGQRFWRRWAQVAGCAHCSSRAGSIWMFPRSFISFGVLHCIAVALIVMRFSGGAGPMAVAARTRRDRVAASSCSCRFSIPDWTNWLGLVTPQADHRRLRAACCRGSAWCGGGWLPVNGPSRSASRLGHRHACLLRLAPLATLGRWSLSFYMLHQPVLIGLLTALIALRAA